MAIITVTGWEEAQMLWRVCNMWWMEAPPGAKHTGGRRWCQRSVVRGPCLHWRTALRCCAAAGRGGGVATLAMRVSGQSYTYHPLAR